jgi:hypothetical protein
MPDLFFHKVPESHDILVLQQLADLNIWTTLIYSCQMSEPPPLPPPPETRESAREAKETEREEYLDLWQLCSPGTRDYSILLTTCLNSACLKRGRGFSHSGRHSFPPIQGGINRMILFYVWSPMGWGRPSERFWPPPPPIYFTFFPVRKARNEIHTRISPQRRLYVSIQNILSSKNINVKGRHKLHYLDILFKLIFFFLFVQTLQSSRVWNVNLWNGRYKNAIFFIFYFPRHCSIYQRKSMCFQFHILCYLLYCILS